MSTRDLLASTATLAADFLDGLDTRAVRPSATLEELTATLGGALPDGPTEPRQVIERLARAAEPGLMANAGGRFFGWVFGGGLPVAVAADWLASAWNQNAGMFACSPAGAVAEEIAGGWLKELLGLPADASFGLVTGCQMAHVTCLAAARNALLARRGWDVEVSGLAGAPPLRVIAGQRVHVTIPRALRLLGLGTAALELVPTDSQGRMDVRALQEVLGRSPQPTIVCGQAGEVNTGAFDDLRAIAAAAREAQAWFHLDGAFGLWAAASDQTRHLLAGAAEADSWATDAHKWLNVPYDCGLAFTRHAGAHRAAMSADAAYLAHVHGGRDAVDWNPEFSRRARGFAVYAALQSLGRRGVAELVERFCRQAREIAQGLKTIDGCTVLNEVVLNQVLFRFEDDSATEQVIARVQEGGEAWVGGTSWAGRRAIRLSVSGQATTSADVARTIEAFRAARRPIR